MLIDLQSKLSTVGGCQALKAGTQRSVLYFLNSEIHTFIKEGGNSVLDLEHPENGNIYFWSNDKYLL